MTRAEFAKQVEAFWKEWGDLGKEETLADILNRPDTGNPLVDIRKIVADVATNGFDPEPTTARRWAAYCTLCKIGVADGSTVPQVGAFMKHHNAEMLAAEYAQESAKRSRPFVGSHKLPFDSDWD